jgi:hypothetical protein
LSKEHNTEALFKAAYLLSQEEELSKDNLTFKLNIDPNRAFHLFNHINKARTTKVPKRRA